MNCLGEVFINHRELNSKNRQIFSLTLCIGVLGVVLTYSSLAASCESWVAKAVSVQGTVEVQRVGERQWQPVKLNDTYCPGDTIRVAANSRADVSLVNQSVLRLNANTTMTLEEVKEQRTSVVEMLKGAIHFFSRGPKSLEVQTPFTTAGVRGTEFFINVDDNKTSLSVFEGEVLAANDTGSLTLIGGQSAIAEAGKAPALHIVVRPRDAVHWALYYPPVLYTRPDDYQTGSGWQGMVQKSVGFYLKGDLQKAFASIESAPDTAIRDSRFFVYRASLLLSVGRVDEAGADIEQALNLNPNDSDTIALQTIIAVVQNENEKALDFAQQAVESDPDSATARIALSYALQAMFDLEGARAGIAEAVQLDPNNALAWARLAELRSSFGDLDGALIAAWNAADLAPNLSRTQTVLGFAYLTEVKTILAKDTFEKAILLDQADPLPRLGIGLAKIRQGDLEEGARDIEIAASLDPNNSLIRSYLGKAYFEEKRTNLSEREYATARELDPNDPTPWFYDAIYKQTTNRPVEALRGVQKAIELNDHRAIYRSRLLLDSDLAARSASLARIYSDLGFQQLALVEGWKSVNTDPSNFSAHRFLADSYSALPRHQIARVSELLQSQLLQPINITPIQPRLGESNLFLISSGGPGGLSFNEFNPLFNRDKLTLQIGGLRGENDTFAGEGVISGIYDKFSFSGGYSHFETDGFRTNNDQDDEIANVFVQAELSHRTSLQFEQRYRKIEKGDLQLRFFGEFRPNERQEEEIDVRRLGLRHTISPQSTLLGSFSFQDVDASLDDRPTGPPINSINIETDERAKASELQYIYRSSSVNITNGVGYFDVEAEDESITELTISVALPPPPFGPGGIIPLDIRDEQTIDRDVDHTNLYMYSTITHFEDVAFTLGASADFFNGHSSSIMDRDQFNPKLGVTWNPFPKTTLRAAVFRVLKRTLITDQTIEPTQVAGFNQFFDDPTGTEAWRYGGAIDQEFTKDIFGGAEFSKRDLTIPRRFTDTATNTSTAEKFDWEEYLGRAYLFWTPHEWLSVRAEYIYEKLERDEEFAFGVRDVDTHRVPLGVSFFHPSGFSTSLTATYFNQEGEFEKTTPRNFESGNDRFWIVDAAINVRLPKRYGFISIGATNLFDQAFNYEDTDPNNPIIQPERVFFTRATLSF